MARKPALVMTFRVAVFAPGEMDNTDLAKMTKHAKTVEQALRISALAAIPASYCPTVNVEEEGVD
jgi:hypothetical protein